MIETPKLTPKSYVSLTGSLRVDCKDTSRLDQLKKDFGQTFHKTNESLLDEKCDDVLIISPKPEASNQFYACTDRNSDRKVEITLEYSSKNNVKKLVGAFKKLSSGKKKTNPPQLGDIIAFSEHPMRIPVQIFTDSKINHVGIMRDDKSLLESIAPKSTVIDFNDRLTINRPDTVSIGRKVYILRLNADAKKKLKENKESFDNEIKDLTGIDYNFKTLFHLAGTKLGLLDSPKTSSAKKDKIICSELVSDILKKIKIIPDNTNTLSVTPRDLTELGMYSDVYERITRVR